MIHRFATEAHERDCSPAKIGLQDHLHVVPADDATALWLAVRESMHEMQRKYATAAWYRQETLARAIREGRRHIADVVLAAAIEAALQPRGRCIECGGGEYYWLHAAGEPDPRRHVFQPPPEPRPQPNVSLPMTKCSVLGCTWKGITVVIPKDVDAMPWRSCREHAATFRKNPDFRVHDPGLSNQYWSAR